LACPNTAREGSFPEFSGKLRPHGTSNTAQRSKPCCVAFSRGDAEVPDVARVADQAATQAVLE
jgi:hypothetical protein